MLGVVLTLSLLLHLAACESASITQGVAYASQRPCAQDCFAWDLYKGPDRLADKLGCDYHNPQNECICRLDLQADGHAFIQSCVNQECAQNTLDTNSAVSIYDAYCTGAGYVQKTPATTTAAPGTGVFPSTVTVTATATVTATVKAEVQATATVTATRTVKVSSAQRRMMSPLHVVFQSLRDLKMRGRDSGSQNGPEESEAPTPTDSGSGVSSGGKSGGGGGGGSNGLDTAGIIGVVVGILGFVATAIGTYFSYKAIKKSRSAKASRV
ncbi:hypothetical protein F4808DRAFT_465258 [Astrocystis sublimbata]|nr:hypothetical protein F4808DRAFT_465258 [Astrocystis sublimbata]